eukprot:g24451.t1
MARRAQRVDKSACPVLRPGGAGALAELPLVAGASWQPAAAAALRCCCRQLHHPTQADLAQLEERRGRAHTEALKYLLGWTRGLRSTPVLGAQQDGLLARHEAALLSALGSPRQAA